MKSSFGTRKLIRAVLNGPPRRTERGAARELNLPNAAQMMKMLRGEIADTPAIKLEKKRRKKVAQKAYWKKYYSIGEDTAPDDQAKLKAKALKLSNELTKAIEELA